MTWGNRARGAGHMLDRVLRRGLVRRLEMVEGAPSRMARRPAAEVTHVSPAPFGAGGIWGGGERFAFELAAAMSELVPTRFVTFGPTYQRRRYGRLTVRVLPARWRVFRGEVNPVSELLLPELARASVLHAHQWRSVVANLCVLAGDATGRGVFSTDLGGASRNYADDLPLWMLLHRFLAVSRFSAQMFPELASRTDVIYGGVDPDRFSPGKARRARQVVFVGRLLPHKGIDVLIRSIDGATPLLVIGRTYNPAFRIELERLARDKQVTFHDSATDADIVEAYRASRVAVLPSVYRTRHGVAPYSELLGLVLLEAMSCGTPVVASDVGGIPEVVADGETGFIVPPGDCVALGDRIRELLDDDALWQSASAAARDHVLTNFTWRAVAERCLDAYAAAGAVRS
jgi:glycosyltransferase involved in cell wall biosynthesis